MVEMTDALVDAGPKSAVRDRGTTVLPVKSAARALDILDDLSTRGPASLQFLAQRLALPKSSLHALLHTMLGRGWLETDATGTIYSLGIHALLVGAAYVDGDLGVARTAPILDEISQLTGETVHMGRLEGANVVYTAKRESTHPLRMYSAVGRRLPATATAMGRALLADRTPAEVEEFVPHALPQLTARSTTDRSAVLAIIDAARTNGYAFEHEESCLGISCFGIVLPYTRPATDAISITVPRSRLDEETQSRIVDILLGIRSRIEQQPPTVLDRGPVTE